MFHSSIPASLRSIISCSARPRRPADARPSRPLNVDWTSSTPPSTATSRISSPGSKSRSMPSATSPNQSRTTRWLYSRVVTAVVHGFGRRPDPRSGDVHEFRQHRGTCQDSIGVFPVKGPGHVADVEGRAVRGDPAGPPGRHDDAGAGAQVQRRLADGPQGSGLGLAGAAQAAAAAAVGARSLQIGDRRDPAGGPGRAAQAAAHGHTDLPPAGRGTRRRRVVSDGQTLCRRPEAADRGGGGQGAHRGVRPADPPAGHGGGSRLR